MLVSELFQILFDQDPDAEVRIYDPDSGVGFDVAIDSYLVSKDGTVILHPSENE